MDISCIFTQKRRELGKPCNFTDVGPHLLVEIDQDPDLRKEFYDVTTMDRAVDCSTKMGASYVNTESCTTESRGMHHVEGAWPAGVDIEDEDSTARFRKKVEKDKSYVNTVKSLADLVENLVMENNSLDVYEEYFDGEIIYSEKEMPLTILNVFNDISHTPRRIVDLSWSYDSSKIAAAYSDEGINYLLGNTCFDSYIWDLQNSVNPLVVLNPELPLNCLEFSLREPNLVIGGYRNGQVGIWDIRFGNKERSVSSVLTSHTQKVTGIKFLESLSNMSFLSASSDGSVMSWDLRDLTRPVEKIRLDPEDLPNLSKKYGISCVEYDPTLPDKFMFGTNQGHILSFKRYSSIVDSLESTFKWTLGPVTKLERNSYFPNIFGSCDPWTVSIWSDSSVDFTILNIVSKSGHFTDFTWSQTRPSMMFVSKTTGVVEVWDFPGKCSEPLKTVQLDSDPLLTISSDHTGSRIACGSAGGTIHLVEISEYLRKSSDLELQLVKSMVVSDVDIGEGLPRRDRLRHVEPSAVPASIRKPKQFTFWDMFDPPETAEELYEEYKIIFEDFPKKEEEEVPQRKSSMQIVREERQRRREELDVWRVMESMKRIVEGSEEDGTTEDDYDVEDTVDDMLDIMEDRSRERMKNVRYMVDDMLDIMEDESRERMRNVKDIVDDMLDLMEDDNKERMTDSTLDSGVRGDIEEKGLDDDFPREKDVPSESWVTLADEEGTEDDSVKD